MRKLFALVATVAMVLSMFAGIAFAVGATPTSIIFNAPSFISTGAAIGFQAITGTVIVTATGAVASDKDFTLAGTYVTGYNSGAPVTATISSTAVKGQINFMLPSNIPAQVITVTATETAGATYAVGSGTITVKYNVTLQSTLEYQYSSSASPVAIIGSVKDGAGKAVVGGVVTLDFINATTNAPLSVLAVTATTNAAGDFGFVVNSWPQAGKLGMFVDGVLHQTGTVSAVAMTLAVTPNTGIVHTIGATQLKFKVTGAPSAVTYTIKKTGITDVAAGTSAAPVNGVVETTFDFTPTVAGTYTVEATVGNTYKASATIVVSDPVSYNMMNVSALEKMDVVGGNIVFGTATGQVHMKQYLVGGAVSTDFQYVVDVDGTNKMAKAATGTVPVAASAPATKQIRVRVYDDSVVTGTYDQLVYDKTYTLNITGWTFVNDTTTMTAGETKTITIVVKNADGVAMNNAQVTVGSTIINGATTNIQNGTYVFENVKFAIPGSQTVAIADSNGVAKATGTIKVTGQALYTVNAPVSKLLLASGEKMIVTTTKDGVTFIPAKFTVQVGTDTAVAQAVTPKDTNSDGIYDAVEMTITPALAADGTMKDLTLVASNADGTQYGEAKFTVVAPTLEVLNDNKVVTNNVSTTLKFRVIDPRTNTAITSNLNFLPAYATTMTLKDVNDAVIVGTTILGASEYTVKVLYTGDYTAATAAKKDVALGFTVGSAATPVTGNLLVKKATITSNPAEVIIGQANNLTLTYADANGVAIADKEIYLGTVATGTLLGKTDAKGQIVYATTGSFALQAKTDVTGLYVDAAINAVVDVKAPVVTAPATSTTNTATITINDNVRVARLMVNGVELNIIPRAELKQVVNLVAGVNTFNIIAVDNNFNVVEQTVTITYTAPVGQKTVLSGAAVERKGNTLFVQVAKFEELGATKSWDAATKTATFICGGKTVVVHIGSTIAQVNGVNVTMPVAPYIVSGRTMVPTRFISENLGWTVDYAAGDIITITLN